MSVSEYALIGTAVPSVPGVSRSAEESRGAGGVYGGMLVAIGAKSYTNCVFSYKKFGNCEKML